MPQPHRTPEPLAVCDSCEQRIRRPNDTLCTVCRTDIDRIYGDLPGARV